MHLMREPQVQWIRKLVLKEGEANRCPANSVKCGARPSDSRKSILLRANARSRRRNKLDFMSRRLSPRNCTPVTARSRLGARNLRPPSYRSVGEAVPEASLAGQVRPCAFSLPTHPTKEKPQGRNSPRPQELRDRTQHHVAGAVSVRWRTLWKSGGRPCTVQYPIASTSEDGSTLHTVLECHSRIITR